MSLSLLVSAWAQADADLFQGSKQDKALGKPLSARFQAGVQVLASPTPAPAGTVTGGTPVTSGTPSGVNSGTSVLSNAVVEILGAVIQAFSASIQPDNTIGGTTYTEFYAFGKRVFSDSEYLKEGNGNVSIDAGLSPAEVRVPLIKYPVGPVILGIDGGARFEADASVQLIPNVGVPITISTLGAELSADLDVAGFIEGYVSFLVIRAGVGGQVDLIDGDATVNARIQFDGTKPFVGVTAWVDFLAGEFYAFLDYFNLLEFKFKRLLNYNLYQWKGYCFATADAACAPK
jgi:hypothetical protein